jgi:hypothetical protein
VRLLYSSQVHSPWGVFWTLTLAESWSGNGTGFICLPFSGTTHLPCILSNGRKQQFCVFSLVTQSWLPVTTNTQKVGGVFQPLCCAQRTLTGVWWKSWNSGWGITSSQS